jgi:hypothetical protein
MNVGSEGSDWVFDWTDGVVFLAGGNGGPGIPANEVTSLGLNFWLVCYEIRIKGLALRFQSFRQRRIKEVLCLLHWERQSPQGSPNNGEMQRTVAERECKPKKSALPSLWAGRRWEGTESSFYVSFIYFFFESEDGLVCPMKEAGWK